MKIWRFFAFLWMLVLVFSCAGDYGKYHYVKFTPAVTVPEHEVSIWVDKTFSAGDLESLDAAIFEWNFVLNGHVKLNIVSRDFDMEPSEIIRIRDADGWIIMKINGKTSEHVKDNTWLAYCDHVAGHYMYMIRDRLQDRDMKQVFMHELGHLLGSEHVGHHLMYKYYIFGRYSCVDRLTAEEVAFHWNLSPDRLNFCVPDS